MPVYVQDVFEVHDDVSWVPHKDMFERFGHVLKIGESEPSLKNLSSVSFAELEAKEAMSLKVKDKHFSSWESGVKSVGFTVQNVRRGYGGFSCELRSFRTAQIGLVRVSEYETFPKHIFLT